MNEAYHYAMKQVEEIRKQQKDPYYAGVSVKQLREIEELVNEVKDETSLYAIGDTLNILTH